MLINPSLGISATNIMDRVTEILGSPSFLVTSLLLLLLYVLYRLFYLPHMYFKRLGISGPKPVPLLGNIGLFWKSGGSFSKVQSSLVQKYGKVSSLYFGTTGGLLVADPDMVKEILIKQFDNFNDRYFGSSSPFTVGEDNVYTIDLVKGEDWRRRRRILSPAFSAHKLKLMVPLLSDSTNRLVEVCSEKADKGDQVDVYDLFSKLTMEIILSCAFGCNVDVQKGAGNQLYKTAMDVMAQVNPEDRVYLMMILLADAYPLFVCVNNLIERFMNARDPLDKLVEASRFVVEKRKKDLEAGNDQRKDLLQLLFEASRQDDHKFLTDGEMVAEIVFILLAGYDTTSNTLAFTAYLLAINTEIQEKLTNTILEYFDDNPDNTVLDAANDLEYVGMVISEAQRMFPPVVFTDRVCTKSCIVSGIPFKKGMFAVIPVRDIHQDPNLWPSPEQFDPERFTAEEKAKRHPCAYLPFGLGPRNCVGMRFALMEAKMALIEIVRHFKILRLPETKVPLETKGLFIQSPKEGTAVVKLQKRE